MTKLKKEGAELLRQADEQQFSHSTKSIRKSMHLEVEEKVQKFCEIVRGLKMPLTQDLIRERALLIEEKLLQSDSQSEQTRHRLTNLSESVGWCQQFVKRHAMKSQCLEKVEAQLSKRRPKAWSACVRSCATMRSATSTTSTKRASSSSSVAQDVRLAAREPEDASRHQAHGCQGPCDGVCCANVDGSGKLPMAIIA